MTLVKDVCMCTLTCMCENTYEGLPTEARLRKQILFQILSTRNALNKQKSTEQHTKKYVTVTDMCAKYLRCALSCVDTCACRVACDGGARTSLFGALLLMIAVNARTLSHLRRAPLLTLFFALALQKANTSLLMSFHYCGPCAHAAKE